MGTNLNLNANSLFELLERFPDEASCLKYLEEINWEGNPKSPFDRSSKVYRMSNGMYRCKNTGRNFTVRTGTIYEHTRVSLRKWFIAEWLMVNDQRGISSYQLARNIKVTQKTAWHMLHKIRFSMQYANINELEEAVEIDETLVGGKNKNRHWNKKVAHSQGRSHKDKTPVVGMIQRGGLMNARATTDTTSNTLSGLIRDMVKKGTVIFTDENDAYCQIAKEYLRYYVDHSRKRYSYGDVTTNRIEASWTHFKRMIIGTYRTVSRKHLQNYVNEFVYRYNFRGASNCSLRFNCLLLCSDPKWTYREVREPSRVTLDWSGRKSA